MVSMAKTSGWVVAAGCALLGGLLTRLLIGTGKKLGWVVIPRQDRWSKRTVVQFGGVPILIAFTVGSAFIPHERTTWGLLWLTLGIGLLGFIDDVIGLGPRPKLAVEILLAAAAVYL